jgi:hypothetical protein
MIIKAHLFLVYSISSSGCWSQDVANEGRVTYNLVSSFVDQIEHSVFCYVSSEKFWTVHMLVVKLYVAFVITMFMGRIQVHSNIN